MMALHFVRERESKDALAGDAFIKCLFIFTYCIFVFYEFYVSQRLYSLSYVCQFSFCGLLSNLDPNLQILVIHALFLYVSLKF